MLAQDHFLKGVNRKSNSGGKVIFHSADSSKNEVHDIVQFSIITKTINFMIKQLCNYHIKIDELKYDKINKYNLGL